MIWCKWYTGELPAAAEAIRRKIFVEELGFSEAFTFDGHDDFSWNLLVKEDETDKGVGRLTIDDDGNYVVQYVGILPEARLQMLGDFALRLLVDKALSGPPAPILADVTEGAKGLFAQVGFLPEDKVSVVEGKTLYRMAFPAGGRLHGHCCGC